MLNVKKTLTKILNTLKTNNSNISTLQGNVSTLQSDVSSLKSRYVIQSHSTSGYSMSANGAHTVSLTITKSGYTPLGIVGYSTAGTYSGYSVATSWYLSDRTSGSGIAHAYVTNRSANTGTWTTTFYVLWQKNI